MCQPTKQLVAAIVVDDRLNNDTPQGRHSRDEPRRHRSAVKRKVSTACSIRHVVSMSTSRPLVKRAGPDYFSAARAAAMTAFVSRANNGICSHMCCQYNGTDNRQPETSTTSDPSRKCDATIACGFMPHPIPARLASVNACVEAIQCVGISTLRLQTPRTHCACN